MISKDQKILIVGLGLIGGSYAEGLTNAGYHVEAITRSQKSIDYALKKGIIKDGTINVSEEYVNSLMKFKNYIKNEITEIGDDEMNQEVELLDRLVKE